MTDELKRDAYQPTNAFEGMDFMGKWCGRCKADINDDCPILAASFCGEVEQWQYERGEPVCTSFDAIDPLDTPHMASAAVADLFPTAPRQMTDGEQNRTLITAHIAGHYSKETPQ